MARLPLALRRARVPIGEAAGCGADPPAPRKALPHTNRDEDEGTTTPQCLAGVGREANTW